MKKERLQQTMQKYKGLQETIMNNYMAIKWVAWKRWIDSEKFNLLIEPGRNGNYEQPNCKH